MRPRIPRRMQQAILSTRSDFSQGFIDGALLGERSAREALTDYSDLVDVDAYCQGTVDGACGDLFRLNHQGS